MRNGMLLGGLATVLAIPVLVISLIALVPPPDEPSSPRDVTKAGPAEYTVAVVDRAIRYHKAHGGAGAVQYYNTPESVDGDWYVFVVDDNKELIAHRYPSLLGKHIDEVGNTIDGRMFSELEVTEAGRWVDYVFVNPLIIHSRQ